MIQTNLYIPKTITVGFNYPKKPSTSNLGYVIYTDSVGKLRKEPSWQAWRNIKIDSICVPNTPRSGFIINKTVQRNGHWGSGRELVRVWDALDFEIELSIDNLIGLLNHATINDRVIEQECVYAWQGTELVLLPTNSEAYQYALIHTDKQANTISPKNIKVGYTYKVKKDNSEVMYLGHFNKYLVKTTDIDYTQRFKPAFTTQHKLARKTHWFAVINNPGWATTVGHEDIFSKSSTDFLSSVNVEFPSILYDGLLSSMYQMVEAQPFHGLTVLYEQSKPYSNDWIELNSNTFIQISTNQSRIVILRFAQYDPSTNIITVFDNDIHKVWQENSTIQQSDVYATLAQLQNAYDTLQLPDQYRSDKKFNSLIAHLKSINVKVGQLRYNLADGKTSTSRVM